MELEQMKISLKNAGEIYFKYSSSLENGMYKSFGMTVHWGRRKTCGLRDGRRETTKAVI